MNIAVIFITLEKKYKSINMKILLVLFIGVFLSLNSFAANPYLDGLTRDQLIERLTSKIYVKDNIYSCDQVAYNYYFSKEAIKTCGFSRLSSSADTGNTMCLSWAMVKHDGSLGNLNTISKKGQKDFNDNYYSAKDKNNMCSNTLKFYSDFIIK